MIPEIKSEYKKINRFLPEILADLKVTSSSPIFSKENNGKNAEHFLSRYISWEGKESIPISSKSHKIMGVIFKKYPNWMRDQKQFYNLYHDPLIDNVKTDWLNHLYNYGYWDLSENLLFEKSLQNLEKKNGMARLSLLAHWPIPKYLDLGNWGLIYFLQMYKRGKGLEGLQLFRKITQLINSVGSPLSQIVAVNMLLQEHFLVHQFNLNTWPLIPKAIIHAYKRLTWMWMGVARSTWLTPLPKDFEPYLLPETGFCAASTDAIDGNYSLLQSITKKTIFDVDFSKNVQKYINFSKKALNVCNKKIPNFLQKRVLAEKNKYENQFESDVIMLSPALQIYSYMRQILLLRMISINTPKYLIFYEQLSH